MAHTGKFSPMFRNGKPVFFSRPAVEGNPPDVPQCAPLFYSDRVWRLSRFSEYQPYASGTRYEVMELLTPCDMLEAKCDGCPPPVWAPNLEPCCAEWPCSDPVVFPSLNLLRLQLTIVGMESRGDCNPGWHCQECYDLNGQWVAFVDLGKPCSGTRPVGSESWTECEWAQFYREGTLSGAGCPNDSPFQPLTCEGEVSMNWGSGCTYPSAPANNHTYSGLTIRYQISEIAGPTPQLYYDATPPGYTPILGRQVVASITFGTSPSPLFPFHRTQVQSPIWYAPGERYRVTSPFSGLCESHIPPIDVSISATVHTQDPAAQVESPYVPGLTSVRGINDGGSWCRMFADDPDCASTTVPVSPFALVDFQMYMSDGTI